MGIHSRDGRDDDDVLDIATGPEARGLNHYDSVIYFGRKGVAMVAESLQDRLPAVERTVARLEGAYEHVATKADVADVKTDIAAINAKLQLLQWITGIGFTIIAGLLIHMLGIIAS